MRWLLGIMPFRHIEVIGRVLSLSLLVFGYFLSAVDSLDQRVLVDFFDSSSFPQARASIARVAIP